MKQNIIIPIKLPKTLFSISTIGDKLIDLIIDANPNWYKIIKDKIIRANSIRIYVVSGSLGLLIDGNIPDSTNGLVIEEGQHFIENTDITNIGVIGIDGVSEIVVQIGVIG